MKKRNRKAQKNPKNKPKKLCLFMKEKNLNLLENNLNQKVKKTKIKQDGV